MDNPEHSPDLKSVPNLRFRPLWPPRTGSNPPPDAAPMRPEILHLDGRNKIRHLNRPQELLQISIDHNLCLEKYIDPIIRGKYALYRIDHEGQFAVAGIKRAENGTWELDEIRGARNEEPPAELRVHFTQWLSTPDHLRA